jgi:hypothetical protein
MSTRFQEYKDKLRVVHRMTLKKVDGEYRVNFAGGDEATAYYTNDLEDAFSTAIDMRAAIYRGSHAEC